MSDREKEEGDFSPGCSEENFEGIYLFFLDGTFQNEFPGRLLASCIFKCECVLSCPVTFQYVENAFRTCLN